MLVAWRRLVVLYKQPQALQHLLLARSGVYWLRSLLHKLLAALAQALLGRPSVRQVGRLVERFWPALQAALLAVWQERV